MVSTRTATITVNRNASTAPLENDLVKLLFQLGYVDRKQKDNVSVYLRGLPMRIFTRGVVVVAGPGEYEIEGSWPLIARLKKELSTRGKRAMTLSR